MKTGGTTCGVLVFETNGFLSLGMLLFTYDYRGRILSALADHYSSEGYDRYRIASNSHDLIIAPAGIRTVTDKVIWVQEIKPGEVNQPHDLIQALGQGLLDAGIHGLTNPSPT